VPPLIEPRLTLLLGEEYLRRVGASDERLPYHLARNYRLLARLPWLRHNQMPDWIRLALLARLSWVVQQDVRAVVEGLLSKQSPNIKGGLRLCIDPPGGGPGPCSGWKAPLPQQKSALYLGFMSGLSARELLLRMPEQWRSWLGRVDRSRDSWRWLREWLMAAFARLLFRGGLRQNGPAWFVGLTAWLLAGLSAALLAAVWKFPPERWPGWWREALFVDGGGALVFRHDYPVSGVAYSPDTQSVLTATLGDNIYRAWDARKGARQWLRRDLDGVGLALDAFAFSPEERAAATASNGKTAHAWKQQAGLIYDIESSPGGQWIVTASADKTARVWEAKTDQPVGEPLRHQGAVWQAVFRPDGQQIATASADGTARLWDAQIGKLMGEPMWHGKKINAATYSPDGWRVATASVDGSARLWDTQTGRPLGQPMRHGGPIDHIAFSPDGLRVVTASTDNTARLWDAATGAPMGEPMRHGGLVRHAEFSPDGQRVVTASLDSTARLWDARTGAALVEPMRHENWINHAAFSPDSRRVVTASSDGIARLWDAQTGKPLGEPMRHKGVVYYAAFSPDGRRLVTADGDEPARLWDAQTGKPLGIALPHGRGVFRAEFSPDGRQVVTVGWDKAARLWDAQTGAALGQALRHENRIWQAHFSLDGRRVLTASDDGTARLWDAQTGAALGMLPAAGPVSSAAFHPDGDRVLMAGEVQDKSGVARIWRIPPYPEPQPAFQFPQASLKNAAVALALLAVLLERAWSWLALRRLRLRMDGYAPRGRAKP